MTNSAKQLPPAPPRRDRRFRSACRQCLGEGHLEGYNGVYLGDLRRSKGLTLRGVARRAGISQAYLSDIESGKRSAETQFERIERIILSGAAARKVKP